MDVDLTAVLVGYDDLKEVQGLVDDSAATLIVTCDEAAIESPLMRSFCRASCAEAW